MSKLNNPVRLLTATLVLSVLIACTQNATNLRSGNEGPGETGAATAAQIHDRTLVLDAHVDIVPMGATSRYGDPDGTSKVTLEKLRAGGVDAVVMAVAVGSGARTAAADAQARQQANAELAAALAMVRADDEVVLATSAQALIDAHKSGKTAIMLGFQNARILESNVAAIDEFYDAGVRVFALTHLGHNNFADSSRPVFDSTTGTYEVARRSVCIG